MHKPRKERRSFDRVTKVGACGLALAASLALFGGTAGAASSGEVELGTALSASVSTSSSGQSMIEIIEVDSYGRTHRVLVPADSVIRISGIAQARQSVNIFAM